MKPKSILTNNFDMCFLCGVPATEDHHIIFGTGKRAMSDREGFVVPLCHVCHRTGQRAIHRNRKADLALRKLCQLKYEETHTREDWIKLCGRNYLD